MDSALYFPYGISLFGLLWLIINAILFIKTFKGKDQLYKILAIYLISLSIEEILCNMIGILKPNTNIFLTHFHFNLQFLFLSIFFYHFFKSLILKRIIVLIYILITISLGIQYYLHPDLFFMLNVLEVALISFTIIVYCLGAIYTMIDGKSQKYFNFFIGLMIYLMTSSLIFLSGNFTLILVEKPIFVDIWVFNTIAFITYQYFIYREWKTLNYD